MVSTDIIKQFEGCKLKSYLCPAKKWTIGYGSTYHPNGVAVKEGDTITQSQADQYLSIEAEKRIAEMRLPSNLNDNQKAALLSLQYNIGQGRWMSSTIRKKVLNNPSDPSIRDEFMKWINKGSSFEKGLRRRRQAEADLYFSNP